MYRAYEIIVNKDNQLEVNLYKVELIREDNNSFYSFTLLNTIPVLDGHLKPIIKKLKEKNYISTTRFKASNFACPYSNSKYAIHSLILPIHHQLLEKVFDEVIIDNMCYINLYITYVNVNTGEVKSLKVGELGVQNEAKETMLEQLGFKYIPDSYLGNYLDEMDSYNKKPFELKRRKND